MSGHPSIKRGKREERRAIMKKRKKINRILLEIGTEEIPAEYIGAASQSLEDIGAKLLKENGLKYEGIRVFSTPRRLSILVEGVPSKQEERENLVSGPPKKVAYDEKGNPTQVLRKFAEAHRVKIKDIVVKNIKNGEYVCIRKVQRGLSTTVVLKRIFPDIIKNIKFPKNMLWPQSEIRFARPIRWICALFNATVIKFSLGQVEAGGFTRGHPSLGRKPIRIRNAGEYEKRLLSSFIIADSDQRKRLIQSRIDQRMKRLGGRILDERNLIDEVNNLVGYPTPIVGSFSKEFLKLPKEIIVNCISHHQKFFPVVKGRVKWRLLPYFVGVRDGGSNNANQVQEGYERVLVARLQDAEFFFKQDLKTSLSDKVERLKRVVFQDKLGSLHDKVKRVIALSEYVFDDITTSDSSLKGDRDTVKRIALLSKADLITEMVKEFPELEGVMGRIYALRSGETKEVAYGIEEHYLPSGTSDRLPVTLEGAIVSIADKVDTLVSDYSVGLIPTGSEDPYGLRRDAGSIVKIILGNRLKIDLYALIDRGFMGLEKVNSLKPVDINRLGDDIKSLFRQRIESILSSQDYGYDEIDAVLSVGFSDILDAEARLKAVHKLRGLEDFEPVTAGFKRAKNILKQAKKFKIDESYLDGEIRDELLKEKEEVNLYNKERDMTSILDSLFQSQSYEKALKELVGLREYIDKFFDKVLVMTEDVSLRDNRLTLINRTVRLFMKIADFSKIVVS